MSNELLQSETVNQGEPTLVFPTVESATTTLPPSFNPAPQRPQHNTTKTVAIIAASVTCILVLAGTALGLYRHHQVQTLTAKCNMAVNAVEKNEQILADLIASDEVVDALNVTKSQVTDEKVISDLKDAVENADTRVTLPDCEIGFFDLGINPSSDVTGTANILASKSAAITNAVKAVNKSVAQKQLNDTKDKLKKAVESANKLLLDSDGKAADNAVRDSLKKAIDSAKKILESMSLPDLGKLTTKALNDAINALNSSIDAMRKA